MFYLASRVFIWQSFWILTRTFWIRILQRLIGVFVELLWSILGQWQHSILTFTIRFSYIVLVTALHILGCQFPQINHSKECFVPSTTENSKRGTPYFNFKNIISFHHPKYNIISSPSSGANLFLVNQLYKRSSKIPFPRTLNQPSTQKPTDKVTKTIISE